MKFQKEQMLKELEGLRLFNKELNISNLKNNEKIEDLEHKIN